MAGNRTKAQLQAEIDQLHLANTLWRKRYHEAMEELKVLKAEKATFAELAQNAVVANTEELENTIDSLKTDLQTSEFAEDDVEILLERLGLTKAEWRFRSDSFYMHPDNKAGLMKLFSQ